MKANRKSLVYGDDDVSLRSRRISIWCGEAP